METAREFVTTTNDGTEIKIVATYVSALTTNPRLPENPMNKRDYISTFGSVMVVYLDKKKVKSCSDPAFWRLIDTTDGKKIWGLPIVFADAEKAEAYNAFLTDLMQDDPEVIAFRAENELEEIAEELERCEQIVSLCEEGWMVDTAEEVDAKRKQWNDLHNEGGYGYVPTWYTRDTYARALDFIAQHR